MTCSASAMTFKMTNETSIGASSLWNPTSVTKHPKTNKEVEIFKNPNEQQQKSNKQNNLPQCE